MQSYVVNSPLGILKDLIMAFLTKVRVEVCQNFYSFMYLVPWFTSVLERKKKNIPEIITLYTSKASDFYIP